MLIQATLTLIKFTMMGHAYIDTHVSQAKGHKNRNFVRRWGSVEGSRRGKGIGGGWRRVMGKREGDGVGAKMTKLHCVHE